MQYVIAAQKCGFACAVLAHEQRDGPQRAALLALKAAHILQDQVCRMVHSRVPSVPESPIIPQNRQVRQSSSNPRLRNCCSALKGAPCKGFSSDCAQAGDGLPGSAGVPPACGPEARVPRGRWQRAGRPLSGNWGNQGAFFKALQFPSPSRHRFPASVAGRDWITRAAPGLLQVGLSRFGCTDWVFSRRTFRASSASSWAR